MSHEGYHEPYEELSPATRDLHRAIVSLMEELEAVDWYQQRADVCRDQDLKKVLEHNRDEEIEHAMMTLEWIRRQVPKVDADARKYLFKSGPITDKAEGEGGEGGPASGGPGGSLGIGTLRPQGGK